MIKLEDHESPPFDFWVYVEAINPEDYQGYDCSDGFVDWVYRSEDRKHQHVMINAKEDPDVFMTIVLNTKNNTVVGHRLLNLREEYGLKQ